MEVYQSTKTADEFEYALGAVPSIGENGNWFIGDQDTGIKAGAIVVSGEAKVGQLIIVKAVDETSGQPSEWEAVDFLSSGYKSLLNTTLTEAVTSLTVTADRDNNPFTAREVFVRMLIPACGTADDGTTELTLGYVYVDTGFYYDNAGNYRYPYRFTAASSLTSATQKVECWLALERTLTGAEYFKYGGVRNNLYSAPTWLRKYSANSGTTPSDSALISPTFENVRISCQSNAFPVGTEIAIYVK